jgi:PAS domain S-box-containing protein
MNRRQHWKHIGNRLGFPALVLCCMIGVSLFLYFNWQFREKSHLSEHQATLDTAYRASVQMYRLAMEGFYANSLSTSQSLEILEQAIDSRDEGRNLARGRLYRLLYGVYESMRGQNLSQLQFHLADGTSFLRFHQPDRYGDPLFDARPGVRICNTEQRIVQGLENGRAGSGFRYLFPLHRNGRHLGSVEVGLPAKSILDAIKGLDPQREYAYVVNKELAVANLFPEQQWLYSQAEINANFLIEDADAVLPNSPAPLSSAAKELNRQLRRRADVQRAMGEGQPLTVSATLANAHYAISLLPMRDVGQRLSGYLITYHPDPLVGKFQQEFLFLIGSAAAALALIFTLIWRVRMHTSALAASKQNLEATHDALAEGVYVQDRGGHITTVNAAAYGLLGYTPEEILGQEAHDLFHRDRERGKTPKEECPFHRHILQGESYDGEEFFETRDGRMLLAEVATRPIIHEEQVVGSVTAFHDITQRKQTEIALRQSEETGRKLSTAVAQSPVSVVVTDAHGTIEYVNAKFVERSGYTIEEAIGQNPRVLKSGLMPEEVYAALWATITAGKEWRGELQNRNKDGSFYWESVSISPIRNPEGDITHFIAIKEDITERRLMEEQLRDNESIQRTLMESLPIGLVIIDAASRVIEQVNPFAASLFGAPPETIVGNTCHHFLCPVDKDCCPISDLGQTVDNSDRIMIGAGGLRIPVLKTVRTINIKGKIKLLECFVDIRERKKTENALVAANQQLEAAIARAEQLAKEAETANQAKSIFLANMSHEIRTPMNAVLGMLHLALRTEMTGQQRDFLGKAEQAAKNLLGVLNDILDFSKVEAGYLQLERVEFDLHKVLDNLITVIAARLQGKPIECTVDIDPDVPASLVGDPLRLGQVLTNLAGNAAKFTEQGEIQVRIRLVAPVANQQARLRFDVVDTGVGLTAEQLGNLFIPFTQADLSTTRQFGGTGLGLSISQRLVQQMGGEISVESVFGQGSRFSFDALFALGVPGEDAFPGANMPCKRVLIVDAHAPARTALRDYLRRLGLEAEEAATCAEGRALLRQTNGQSPCALLFLAEETKARFDAVARTLLADLPAERDQPDLVWLAPLRYRSALEDTELDGAAATLYKPVSFHALAAVVQDCTQREKQPLGQQATSAAEYAAEPIFSGGRVLLAEDKKINQLVAVGILEHAGLEVLLAGNGEEAVKLAATEPVDCILMDIQMPIMDGIEATRAIRRMPGGENLPIIAMTAYATVEEQAKTLAAGMNAHVAKPIEPPKLFATLRRWLPAAYSRGPATQSSPGTRSTACDGPADTGASPVSPGAAPHAAAILQELEVLLAALGLCKPKLCTASLERLRQMALPDPLQAAIETIDGHIGRYAFTQAQEVVEAARATIRATNEDA